MRITHAQQHTFLTLTTLVGIVFVSLFALIRTTDAAPNYQMNYQGKLTNAANVAVADGTYNMRFWLLTSPSIATTSATWTEQLTGTNKVQVTNGLFSVMLGSTTPLTGVDFNQTLYLGVEIGGTSTPAWDGEMSPRKVLGTVPAAFEANKLDGLDSTQFVRTDATSTIATSSANTLLTLTQSGVGDIFNLFDGTTEVFTMTDGGRMGLGTTSPSRLFTMQGGDFWLGGNMTATGTLTVSGLATLADFVATNGTTTNATSTNLAVTNLRLSSLRDSANSLGTSGMVLQTNGSVSTWVSTTTLGLLTTAAFDTSAELAAILGDETGTGFSVFSTNPLLSGFRSNASSTIGDGTNTGGLTIFGGATSTGRFAIGSGVNTDIFMNSGSTTLTNSRNVAIGNQAFTYFTAGAFENIGIGYLALYGSSTSPMIGDDNIAIGERSLYNNTTGSNNIALGSTALINNTTGSNNIALGPNSFSTNTTGSNSIALGSMSLNSNTTGSGNIALGPFALVSNVSGASSTALGYAAGRSNITGSLNTFIGLNAGYREETNGILTGPTTPDNLTNAIALGANAQVTQSNALVLGGLGAYSVNTVLGTTSPWAKLSIMNTYGATTPLFDVATTTNIGGSATSSLFRITANGNVGIGSTSPNYKLDVNGTVNATAVLVNGVPVGTGSGSVSSVDMSVPTGFSISGNPITTTGTLALSYAAGYEGLLTSASTTLFGFYNTPSTRITDGTGLTWSSNTLNCDTANGSTQGCITSADWTTFMGKVASSSIDTLAELETFQGGINIIQSTEINTSALLAGLLGDETGTGNAVFSNAPTFTGTAAFNALTVTATSTLGFASSTALTVSGNAYLNTFTANSGTTTNASSTNLFATNANFTNLSATTLNPTNLVATNGTTTNASSTNFFATNARFTNSILAFASSTGLTATNGYFTNATIGAAAGILTTNGSGLVAASTTVGDQYIADNLTLSGGTIGSNNISGTLTTTGNLTIGDNGDVINIDSSSWDVNAGAFTGITNLSVTGSSTIGGGTGATGLTIFGGATTTGNAYFGRNVGIGSSTPGFALTVLGEIYAKTPTSDNVSVGYSNNNAMSEVVVTGFGNTITSAQAVVFGSNNSVGYNSASMAIGRGNNSSSGGVSLGRSNTTGIGSAYAIGEGNTASADGSYAIGASVNNSIANSLQIGPSDSAKLTILSSGNVGIGTTTPSQKLTVSGNIAIDTGAVDGFVYWNGQKFLSASSTRYNTFLGLGAGTSIISGSGNTGVGNEVLQANTSGDFNTATGYRALFANTTGGSNVAFGDRALGNNIDGWENTAVGANALRDNTSGGANVAIGRSSLIQNTSGSSNTAVGVYTLTGHINGDFNTALGRGALQNNTTGTSSTGIGYQAGGGGGGSYVNQGGVYVGVYAGYSAGTGSDYNTIVGYQSGRGVTTGSQNILMGYNAGYSGTNLTTGSSNIIIGNNIGATSTTMTNGLNIGNLLFGTGIDGTGTTLSSGNIGIGTSSPAQKLSIAGGMHLTGALYDRNYNPGTNGMVLQTTGSGIQWVATSSLGFSGGASTFLALTDTPSSFTANRIPFTNSGATALIDSANFTFDGSLFAVTGGLRATASSTIGGGTGSTGLTIFGGATTTGNAYFGGIIGIGTTTPTSILTMGTTSVTGSVVAGIKQHFGFTNSTLSALMYGDETYITNAPTATSTLVGKMMRIADTSALGNTVRGLEIQAHRGTNTKGENTGIAGFGRTFGVRGSTMGDAGSTYLPAGMFAESEGTTQGNALRAYSGTMTTESLVYFFQDTSNFTGTGLKMDFGNAGGSFAATTSAKFVDLKVGGTSKFTIAANGSTTIGDGTVSASLRIPYGGICVDNDGSCVSTTTGQIRSVTSALGNSDLAEMYFSNQTLHAGEIVSLAGGLSVKRASEDTEENIIGVVSTKPGMTLGFDDTSLALGESGYPVGLKGRVPIKLSTENGPITKGDRIALSSIPGVGMKADESSRVVGIALEDYDGTKAYSAGFLNQFGDDMLKERVITRTTVDARTQDGCYNGAGNALGEAACVAKKVKTTTVVSENPEETRASMLAELTNESPEMMTNGEGETLAVGQAIMFIELTWYQVDRERMVLSELATTSPLFEGSEVTLWDNIKALASHFVDGVLSVTGIKADRVEVQNELCVDGVCVTADDLRAILQSTRGGAEGGDIGGGNETSGGDTGSGEVTGGESGTGSTSEGGDISTGNTEGVETPTEPTPAPTEEPPVVEEPTPEAPAEPEAPQESAPEPQSEETPSPEPTPSEPVV